MTPAALEGIRVLDLTRVISGPYCTLMLADMGADVIKIEEPTKGDEERHLHSAGRLEYEDFFYILNRNKRSVGVNLKAEEGKRIIYDLASRVHVVVENFAPGVATRLGIDYERLSQINPSLVYTSVSGFGQDGPYRDRKAYDTVIQALAGLTSVTGHQGADPARCGIFIADVGAGMTAAFSTLSALFYAQRTGRGQHVDIAMLDSLLAMWTSSAAEYLFTGIVPKPWGTEIPHRVPSGSYRTSDGRFILIVANTPSLWQQLCDLLGMPEVATDPRFDTPQKRIQDRHTVNALIEQKTKQKTLAEWEAILGAGGIPYGRVNTLDETLSDPQVLHRNMITSMEHPVAGTIPQIGSPYRMSVTPGRIRTPAPLLGQHTEEVLVDFLGYNRAYVASLLEKRVISRTQLPKGADGEARLTVLAGKVRPNGHGSAAEAFDLAEQVHAAPVPASSR